MATSPPILLLDEITDFLATSPNAEQIIAFEPSEDLAQRALDLLERKRNQQLTQADQAEFESFMQMEHFMTILKAKARLKLAGK